MRAVGVVYVAPDSTLRSEPGAAAVAVCVVRIELEGDAVSRSELHGQIKPGMTAEIVTRRQSILSILIRGVRQAIGLG